MSLSFGFWYIVTNQFIHRVFIHRVTLFIHRVTLCKHILADTHGAILATTFFFKRKV